MLLGLFIFFALPILLVLVLYQSGWRPGGSSHGELLSPAQPLQLPVLHDPQGRPFGLENWKGKWSLVYASSNAACDASCQQQVHLLRQIHVTLNKDIDRAQRILLLSSTTDTGSMLELQKRYPGLIVLASEAQINMASLFKQSDQADGIFLVDPLGNLIMRYAPGYDPNGLRKDLQRLLKYSWVG